MHINPFVCLGFNKLIVDEKLGGWLKNTVHVKQKEDLENNKSPTNTEARFKRAVSTCIKEESGGEN